jgi:hypothetical protein
MFFLNPWAILLGTLGIGLPVLIHWLTRPRPQRLQLSTLRFVQEVIHQRRTFHRLRNLLILTLRTLAVLLIAWAFARPLIGQRPLISTDDKANAARVVILDVSQSMDAGTRGIQAFERARPLAAKYLSYRPGLVANLVFAGAQPAGVFESCSSNLAALREELSKSAVRPEKLNIAAAVTQAADMLVEASDDASLRRELIVISDFQRSNWAAADFSALPKDTLIQLESVAPAEPPANLAILNISCHDRIEQNRDIRMEVEVGNYSPAARQVHAELKVGDASYQLEGLCPAGMTVTLTTKIKLNQIGWQVGQVRLSGVEDALLADNSRWFVIDVHPKCTYALITREATEPRPCSSHYLERALMPKVARSGQSKEKVVRIAASQLSKESLAGSNMIVLDHPGKLSTESIQLLTALLRRGRPLFYVTAEPADATNLRRIADAAGTDMQLPVQLMAPSAGQFRRDLFITEMQEDQPPFSAFGDRLSAAISPLRFAGGLTSRRTEGGLIDDLLASYSDRSACMVVTACGAGSLALLNADLALSNLPRSPAFVPLIGELVERLLHTKQLDNHVACGEPVARDLPIEAGGVEGLTITGEDSANSDYGQLIEEGPRTQWLWPIAGAPGIYRIERDETTVFALATGIDSQESNLATISSAVLTDRLAGGRNVHFQSAAAGHQEGKDNLWPWLAVACMACMLVELIALKAFRT